LVGRSSSGARNRRSTRSNPPRNQNLRVRQSETAALPRARSKVWVVAQRSGRRVHRYDRQLNRVTSAAAGWVQNRHLPDKVLQTRYMRPPSKFSAVDKGCQCGSAHRDRCVPCWATRYDGSVLSHSSASFIQSSAHRNQKASS
jgi:hypothetical protein